MHNTKKKILLVEDNDNGRYILGLTLQRFGYEIYEAESGAAAVEQALALKPDLIIMDLGLPGMSGIEAAQAVKENAMTEHIPIIAYTAWSHREWKKRALDAGMVDYMEKPVSADVMKGTIAKFL